MRRHVTVFLHGMWTFFFFSGCDSVFPPRAGACGPLAGLGQGGVIISADIQE